MHQDRNSSDLTKHHSSADSPPCALFAGAAFGPRGAHRRGIAGRERHAARAAPLLLDRPPAGHIGGSVHSNANRRKGIAMSTNLNARRGMVAAAALLAFQLATPTLTEAADPLTVGVLLPGSKTDKGWMESGYDGLMAVQKEL